MKTEQLLPVEKIRNDFPILNKTVHDKPLAYLDSSATSLTPRQVVTALQTYYTDYNANVHRGLHNLSEQATNAYEEARKTIATFIHAKPQELIFTKGTTESLNLLAYTLTKKLNEGDEIVLTEMEHHSNIVPWQQLAQQKKIIIKYIKLNNGMLDIDHAQEIITNKTKIVSVTHMSNVLGTINNIQEFARIAHKHDALLIVDGAQAIPHLSVDVKELDCDFYCFSGHKMLGPTGIGIVYGKQEHLTQMDPFQYGGDMINEVHFDHATWNELPWKFEAGTPPIAEAIALAQAVEYIQTLGMDNIKQYTNYLTEYALQQLQTINGVTVYGPQTTENRGSVISFNIEGIHSHDVATILDREGVAIRGGHLCAMPLVTEALQVPSVCRASFYIYNTKTDIDTLINGIKKAQTIFTP